jgi:hypothetical protein
MSACPSKRGRRNRSALSGQFEPDWRFAATQRCAYEFKCGQPKHADEL